MHYRYGSTSVATTTMGNPPYHPIEFREGTESHYRDGLFYDRRYRGRQADVRHYTALAQRHGGPVLELGVGTGRVARRVAALGLDVVGIDGMETMLERARGMLDRQPRALRKRIRLQQGDLRTLDLSKRFPLVIAPFNVFMHLYTRADIEAALGAVKRHLAPGGRFAFDVSNPDPRVLARDPTRLYRCRPVVRPENGQRYNYSETFHYDPTTQVMHVHMIMEMPDDPQDVHITTLSQRQFFPAELEAFLSYNGFAVESFAGDFDGAALSATSESLVIVATLESGSRAE